MRRVFSLEDPAQGSTVLQDQAYKDLEQLTCGNVKHIIQYMNEYLRLAAKSGRTYISPELSEKFWLKMPGDLGARIKIAFEEKYPGLTVGVIPRVLVCLQIFGERMQRCCFQAIAQRPLLL